MYDLAQHAPDFGLYLLNPHDVRQFIEAMGEQDKTDAKDAYGVADRQRVRRPEHELRMDMPYLALRRLTRYRFSLVQQLASEKVRLSNFVYLKASAYMTVKPFSDIFGATSQQVLSGELTLDELAALPTAELAEQLQAYGRQRFAEPEQRAALLKQVAAESFPLPDEMVVAVDTVLNVGLAHIAGLEQRIVSLDQPIATAAGELPGYELLRSIRGIGPVYAAGLVAEIGDVGRFLEGSKRDRRGRRRAKRRRDAEAGLAKLAGLYWPRKESGEFKGEDRPMSKRGNVYLRYYLIQAANSVRLNDPTYAAFYARKYRQAVRHKHRRALVLTARKLVRLICAMLADKASYRPKDDVVGSRHVRASPHRWPTVTWRQQAPKANAAAATHQRQRGRSVRDEGCR